MNTFHSSPVCRLAFGASRVQIRLHPQIRKVTTTSPDAASTEPVESPDKSTSKEVEERPNGQPLGHGEKLWIHHHIYEGQVIYSFSRTIDSNKGFRQLPYTGKKLLPAKLRRDYWRPLALVEFQPGLGDAGRSVFHKLREFKKRHELEWGWEDAEEEKRMLTMSKHQRGKVLNNQKANAVADLAAVLSGVGKGSKMWKLDWEFLKNKSVKLFGGLFGKTEPVVLREEDNSLDNQSRRNGAWLRNRELLKRAGISIKEGPQGKYVDVAQLGSLFVSIADLVKTPMNELEIAQEKERRAKVNKWVEMLRAKQLRLAQLKGEEPAYTEEPLDMDAPFIKQARGAKRWKVDEIKTLHPVKVYWADEQSRFQAEKWSDNVEHVLGLPSRYPEAVEANEVEEQEATPTPVAA
ncbi:hypothetical protein OQA88_141 [Cercophora sp. LCS_1]